MYIWVYSFHIYIYRVYIYIGFRAQNCRFMCIGSIVCVGSRVYVGLIQGLYEYRCIEGHRFIPVSQGVSVYGFICIRVYAGLRVWGYRWLWGHAGYVFKYT